MKANNLMVAMNYPEHAKENLLAHLKSAGVTRFENYSYDLGGCIILCLEVDGEREEIFRQEQTYDQPGYSAYEYKVWIEEASLMDEEGNEFPISTEEVPERFREDVKNWYAKNNW